MPAEDPELERTLSVDPALRGVPAASAAARPSLIGRFEVETELGRGGMGVVYRAFDPLLERTVAIKVLSRSGEGSGGRDRLLREAQSLARLQHPNVVAIHEVGEFHGQVYLAMEFLSGGTLRDWQASQSPRERVRAYLAAGEALSAAHRAGLVHRDFKPDNVSVDQGGRVRLLDFGLARTALDPSTCEPDSPLALSLGGSEERLTQAGSLVGTPAYMAPEQLDGHEAGPEADQFAFCAALWEALVGERPFVASELEGLRRAMDAGPPAVRETGWRRKVLLALVRGLRVAPSERYPTLRECLAHVQAAAGDERFDLDVGRRQRRQFLWFVLLLTVVAELLLSLDALQGRDVLTLLKLHAAGAVALGAGLWRWRDAFQRSAANRKILLVAAGGALLPLWSRTLGLLLGAPPALVLASDLGLIGALMVGAYAREASWLAYAAATQFGGALLCALFPGAVAHIFTLDILATSAVLAWHWER